MEMFGRHRRTAEPRSDRPRYVSSLQKDVRKYVGWTREDVERDYRASKAVHTIVTIGYLEYADDILVLTEKGRLLMQNVAMAQPVAERTPYRKVEGGPVARAVFTVGASPS